MSKRDYRPVFEIMALAFLIAVLDMIIGFFIALAFGTQAIFVIASNLLFIEFGLMLILGACLMSRQPLDDAKRYDAEGNITRVWELTLLGRMILAASLIVILLAILFTVFSL